MSKGSRPRSGYTVPYRKNWNDIFRPSKPKPITSIVDDKVQECKSFSETCSDDSVDKALTEQRGGFTIIEVLVVLAIMCVVAAMLLPAIARAKQRAEEMERKKHVTEQVQKPDHDSFHVLQRDSWGNVQAEKVTIDGHEYIATSVGIVHNENCACRKK